MIWAGAEELSDEGFDEIDDNKLSFQSMQKSDNFFLTLSFVIHHIYLIPQADQKTP